MWVKKRRRPIGERNASPGVAIGHEITKTVGYRLPHSVRVNACERRENTGRGVRDQRSVVVGHQHAIVANKVEQVWHLLEVRGHVWVVTAEMGVVKLDVYNVLNVPLGRVQLARILR